MRYVLLAVLLCLGSPAFCQSKATNSGAPDVSGASIDPYKGEAVILEQSDTSYRYNADGTGEEQDHVRMKVQNDAGARQFSVLSIGYAAATQAADFESVRVTHVDGTSTDTPITDAMDMPAPVTQQAPLYSDLKVVQLPVRGLRVGDTLEYKVRIDRKNPETPSEFWDNFTFTKSAVVFSQTLTLDVPADKYVQVWSPTVKPVIAVADGRRVYRWSGNQLKSTTVDNKKDADEKAADTKPSVEWTTFHSWQEVGDWYRGLAAPRAAPTDALRSQADEITRDAKTPEEQIQAIYSFVATRIRYVGIDFGIGRFQPHAAAEVLANQYGDCKDKDTLLEALLRAKGFTTAPALIGVNIDMVSDVPSPAQFNHVITTATLPSGQIWMDATPEVVPFRLLISPIRDKEALVIPAAGTASLERTPAETPFAFVDRFEATATLKDTGELNGHVDITDRSDTEIVLRALARNLAPAQWDKASQYLANLMGFSGTTSNSSFGRADDFSNPMHLSYDYTRKPYGDWDNYQIVPLFPVVELPQAPDKQPSSDIDLGAPRTEIAESRIKLPDGYGADLLDAVHVKTRFLSFDKTYRLENGELVVKRTIVVFQSKLPADEWMVYQKFAKEVSLGEENWIQLTTTDSVKGDKHPPKASADYNPAAAELIQKATELEKDSDWAGATKTLDSAKEINSKQAFLWSNYGFIAMRQSKPNDAKKYFGRELELHPDETYVVMMYANYLRFLKQDQDALSVLSSSFKSDPTQEQVVLMLASLQVKSSVADSIATLRRAATSLPDDKNIELALASYLVRDHQNAEATTILKKQIETADDPNLLNNASYELAEAGTELPLAEQKTRQALDTLDTKSAQAEIGEANEESFQRASLLVATWDTLGYILLQENKLDEAQDYLRAAWANRTSPDVGQHYGELLEKQGKPREALHVYQIADGARTADASELNELKQNIARLEKDGTKPIDNGAATSLQDARTFQLIVKSAHPNYVSATFRLQLSAEGAPEILRVSGDPALDEASDAIRTLKLPHYVPAKSTARLLRDAVVTCSPGKKDCFFVLMPLGGIQAERTVN